MRPLLGLENFPTRVVTAVRADHVRAARLAALRAGLKLHELQRQMGAAPAFPRLGELYLRESHEPSGSLPTPFRSLLEEVREPVRQRLAPTSVDVGGHELENAQPPQVGQRVRRLAMGVDRHPDAHVDRLVNTLERVARRLGIDR